MIYLGGSGEVWEGCLIPALGSVYQLRLEDLLSIFCSEDPDVGGVTQSQGTESLPTSTQGIQGAGAEVRNRKRF